jgi:predicted DNA-binding transcriptional regulator AlpA
MGLAMTAKTDLPEVPAALADAALIDGPTCAATGCVSVSWWQERVARGDAPQPVIRQPRFTRWRLADVNRFWLEFAERSTDDGRIVEQAKKASIKARAKREAAQSAHPRGA